MTLEQQKALLVGANNPPDQVTLATPIDTSNLSALTPMPGPTPGPAPSPGPTPSGVVVTTPPSPVQDNDLWGNLGAGGYSALNEATLGLPELIVKAANTDAYKKLKEFQAKHQLASDIGSGVGLVGSAFIPGGAILKGVGLAGKVLGAGKLGADLLVKAGEKLAAPATGFVGNALKIGGQAAEQGAVRVATGNETPLEAAEQTGIGALTGGVLGKIAQKLPASGALTGDAAKDAAGIAQAPGESLGTFGVNELKEGVNKLRLNSLLGGEGNTRALRSAINAYGLKSPISKVKNVPDYLQDVVDFADANGIQGKRGFDAALKQNGKNWNAIDDAFQKNAPETWNSDLINHLTNDPDVVESVVNSGQKSTQDLADEVAKTLASPNADIMALRNKLGNIVKGGITSPDPAINARAQAAGKIKSSLYDFIADNSQLDPDFINSTKHTYKVLQPWIQSEARDVVSLKGVFGSGSPTEEKESIRDLLARGAAGAGTGAAASGGLDVAQGQDFDPGKALLAAGAGSVLGGAAPKILAGLANIVPNQLAKGASAVLRSNPELAEQAGAASEAIGKGLTVGGGPAAAIAARLPQALSPGQLPNQATPQINPDTKEPLPDSTGNYTISEPLRAKLNEVYHDYYKDLTPQDFVDKVLSKTKNFSDPEISAKIIYPNDVKSQEEYVKNFSDYNTVKKLNIFNDQGTGPGKAITGNGFGLSFIADPEYQALRQVMINQASDHDISKREEAAKRVDKDLSLVRQFPSLLPELLSSPKYNLQGQNLKQLGVLT